MATTLSSSATSDTCSSSATTNSSSAPNITNFLWKPPYLLFVVATLILGMIMACTTWGKRSNTSTIHQNLCLSLDWITSIGIVILLTLLLTTNHNIQWFTFLPAVHAAQPERQQQYQEHDPPMVFEDIIDARTVGNSSNHATIANSSSSAAASHVPFIVVREPKWAELSRAIDRYDADATKLLQTLSRALEVALLSEADLKNIMDMSSSSTSSTSTSNSFGFHKSTNTTSNSRPLLLSERLKQRIETLARLLEQDGILLRQRLLQPFPVVHALPRPCDLHQDNHTTKPKTTTSSHTRGSSAEGGGPPERRQGPCRSHTRINHTKDNDPLMESSSYNSAFQILAHIVRDWSVLGQPLRDSLYGWCITQLQLYHPIETTARETTTTTTARTNPRTRMPPRSVLVPGAGLGRLAWELARLGYAVEANEASLVMAATAHALLNHPHYQQPDSESDNNSEGTAARQDIIHPFLLDGLTNEVDSQRRYEAVVFPDQPTTIIEPPPASHTDEYCISEDETDRHHHHHHHHHHLGGSLSYTIGDFVKDRIPTTTCGNTMMDSHDGSETSGGTYGAVVTCFFVDTATNVYEYVALIHELLVPHGGLWINVGPLQWHRNSILPVSADELKDILQLLGFDILHWSVDTTPLEYRQHEGHGGDGVGVGDPTTRWTNYDAYRPLRFVAQRRK